MTKKIEPYHSANLNSALRKVLRNTVAFLDCPLTDDQMLAVWHDGYPAAVIESLKTLSGCDFINPADCGLDYAPTFAVPQLGVSMRFERRSEEGPLFTSRPTRGPHRMAKYTMSATRATIDLIQWGTFEKILNSDEQKLVIEWAHAAAQCTIKHKDAHVTINQICKMLSTAGQLKRMVPELVDYLPLGMQIDLLEQKRASPFPPEWAGYPKDRVEKLLTAMAEGHLCKGINQRDVDNGVFSWAEYLPK